MKRKASNSKIMKNTNRKLILEMIREKPISRAELARETGLTRAAVTIIVEKLLKEGIITEEGTVETDYGRKPILLGLNPNSYFVFGVNISRCWCSVGLVDIKGKPIKKVYMDISNKESPERTVEKICKRIDDIIKETEVDTDRIIGLGISAPGPLDVFKGRFLNPPSFDRWHGFNIVGEMERHYPFKIKLENNAVALTIAEKSYGSGRYKNFILLVVDTGIGAGIILNDRLYKGKGGFGCEVGHTSINIKGEKCRCGNRGCLETYASIPAVVSIAKKQDDSVSTWNDIVDRAIAGDTFFEGLVDDEARYLSAGLVNTINILELEAVVLTGYITYKPEMFLTKIMKYFNSSYINRNFHDVQLEIFSISEDAEIISSAAIMLEEFFSN